jgi:hypothetical protein
LNAARWIIARQLHVDELEVFQIVDTRDDDVLLQGQVLVDGEEAEGLCMDFCAVDSPGKDRLGDEVLCKGGESLFVVDVEGGELGARVSSRSVSSSHIANLNGDTHLVDLCMACRCSNPGQVKVAQVYLPHVWRSGHPVHIDWLSEVKLGWEDAGL